MWAFTGVYCHSSPCSSFSQWLFFPLFFLACSLCGSALFCKARKPRLVDISSGSWGEREVVSTDQLGIWAAEALMPQPCPPWIPEIMRGSRSWLHQDVASCQVTVQAKSSLDALAWVERSKLTGPPLGRLCFSLVGLHLIFFCLWQHCFRGFEMCWLNQGGALVAVCSSAGQGCAGRVDAGTQLRLCSVIPAPCVL